MLDDKMSSKESARLKKRHNFPLLVCQGWKTCCFFSASNKESKSAERQKQMEYVAQGIFRSQHIEALEILLQHLRGVLTEHVIVQELHFRCGTNLGVEPLRSIFWPSWTVRYAAGAVRGFGAEAVLHSSFNHGGKQSELYLDVILLFLWLQVLDHATM